LRRRRRCRRRQVFLLCVKADLENIASLEPEEHHRWCLDVRAHTRRATRAPKRPSPD
jgi:hypothetical protein